MASPKATKSGTVEDNRFRRLTDDFLKEQKKFEKKMAGVKTPEYDRALKPDELRDILKSVDFGTLLTKEKSPPFVWDSGECWVIVAGFDSETDFNSSRLNKKKLNVAKKFMAETKELDKGDKIQLDAVFSKDLKRLTSIRSLKFSAVGLYPPVDEQPKKFLMKDILWLKDPSGEYNINVTGSPPPITPKEIDWDKLVKRLKAWLSAAGKLFMVGVRFSRKKIYKFAKRIHKIIGDLIGGLKSLYHDIITRKPSIETKAKELFKAILDDLADVWALFLDAIEDIRKKKFIDAEAVLKRIRERIDSIRDRLKGYSGPDFSELKRMILNLCIFLNWFYYLLKGWLARLRKEKTEKEEEEEKEKEDKADEDGATEAGDDIDEGKTPEPGVDGGEDGKDEPEDPINTTEKGLVVVEKEPGSERFVQRIRGLLAEFRSLGRAFREAKGRKGLAAVTLLRGLHNRCIALGRKLAKLREDLRNSAAAVPGEGTDEAGARQIMLTEEEQTVLASMQHVLGKLVRHIRHDKVSVLLAYLGELLADVGKIAHLDAEVLHRYQGVILDSRSDLRELAELFNERNQILKDFFTNLKVLAKIVETHRGVEAGEPEAVAKIPELKSACESLVKTLLAQREKILKLTKRAKKLELSIVYSVERDVLISDFRDLRLIASTMGRVCIQILKGLKKIGPGKKPVGLLPPGDDGPDDDGGGLKKGLKRLSGDNLVWGRGVDETIEILKGELDVLNGFKEDLPVGTLYSSKDKELGKKLVDSWENCVKSFTFGIKILTDYKDSRDAGQRQKLIEDLRKYQVTPPGLKRRINYFLDRLTAWKQWQLNKTGAAKKGEQARAERLKNTGELAKWLGDYMKMIADYRRRFEDRLTDKDKDRLSRSYAVFRAAINQCRRDSMDGAWKLLLDYKLNPLGYWVQNRLTALLQENKFETPTEGAMKKG